MERFLHILLGCLLTSIGTILLQHAGVITGGTAGLSLLLSYVSHLPFAVVFFCINLPFYILSVKEMGWNFTLSSILSVTTLSLMTGVDELLPSFSIPMAVGAIVGGVIIGFGISILFMSRTSLGGTTILALIFQKRFGWDPGKTTFFFDFVVVLFGFYSVGIMEGTLSILSIAVTSGMISYFKQKIAASNKTAQQASNTPKYAASMETSLQQ